MSAERVGQHTIENLVEQLNQRNIDRQLHGLSDEGFVLLLEGAAVRAGNIEAQQAARDLRKHILNGGTPKDFLTEFPQHREVDFTNFNIDESLLDITQAPTLLLSVERPALGVADGKMAEESLKKPELTLSPAGNLRVEELFATYPSLDTLFSDESTWTEEGGARFIERKRLQSLLTKKDPSKPMSDSHRTWLMNQLWIEWKKSQPEQTGRYITGKGKRIYLTPEEAVNFAWFVHNTTQEPTSTYRNYTFIGAIASATEDSKKK